MKKIFLTMLIVCSIMTVFAATQIDSSATSTGLSLNDTAVYNDGKAALQSMVVGAKDLATNGYDIVVQQQRMYAFQYVLVGILCLICIFLFVRYYGQATGAEKVSNKLVPAIIFGVIGIWTGIVFSLHFTEIMQGLVNPDYAAIKDIVTMFKK